MKLTGAGKVVLFLLVIGFGIGAWRLMSKGKGLALSMPSLPGKSTGSTNVDNNGGDLGNSDNGGDSGSGATQILLLTSPSKGGWLQDEIEKFNTRNAGRYEIKTTFEESREGMHAIIGGAKRPVLYAPSFSAFATRVDE